MLAEPQMKLSDIRIDLALVEAGEWISDIPGLAGIELFTRGVQNEEWLEVEARMMRSRARSSELMGIPREFRTLSNSAANEIINQCLHQTCLKNWRGVDDPYNYEVARRLIFEPENRLFREGLLWAAEQVGRPKELRGHMPIITEASVIVDEIRGHKFEAGATIEDFERGGTAAGEECGRSFEKVYGRNSNADVTKFPAMLRGAMESACEQMKQRGASVENVSAWHDAFLNAARPSIPNIDLMFDRSRTVDGVCILDLAEL